MNLKQVIALIYFGLAILIFEVMNWYGTKYIQPTWATIARYALYTLPLQFIAYVLLVWGLNLGYTQAGKDIWSLIITTTTITWSIKICTAYCFFQKTPTAGRLIALVLLVAANLFDKIWK